MGLLIVVLITSFATPAYAQGNRIRVRDHTRIMFDFDHVGDFENGLAVVWRGNEKAVVNTFVEIVVPFAPTDVSFTPAQLGGFSQGLAAVQTDNRWGFKDMYGNMVVAPQYDAVTNFSEGYAWVMRDGNWGLIEIYEPSTAMTVIMVVFGGIIAAAFIAFWVFKRK